MFRLNPSRNKKTKTKKQDKKCPLGRNCINSKLKILLCDQFFLLVFLLEYDIPMADPKKVLHELIICIIVLMWHLSELS